jgi:thymidylate kinase
VRDGFFELVKAAPARWRVINADKNVEELQKEIREIVMGVLR